MHILIVEDNALFSEILHTFLSDKGCNAIVVGDLKNATQKLSVEKFDFILLDNHLPDGTGTEFLDILGELDEKPPVIMVTADDNQEHITDAFERGADDFLIKPINVDLLWRKILRNYEFNERERQLACQNLKLEGLLNHQEQQEKLARYVYNSIAETAEEPNKFIHTYLQSSSIFNGDVFISGTSPNGNLMLFLADATGHGLSAAMSTIPMVSTLKAMIKKGLPLPHLLHEVNNKLNRELPDDKFVALIGIEMNFHLGTIAIFNGGMPDVVILKRNNSVERLRSGCFALGIADGGDFDPNISVFSVDQINSLLIFSDGLIEQTNKKKEAWGIGSLIELIETVDRQEPLLSHVINQFSCFIELEPLSDDLSVCCIEIAHLFAAHTVQQQDAPTLLISGNFSTEMRISNGMLARADILGCLNTIMRSIDVRDDLRQRAFTVFAELISNGLDHGILQLDSALKNDAEGFSNYIEQKQDRLQGLSDADELILTFHYSMADHIISFDIVDSGKGFTSPQNITQSDQSLSGRGLLLINELCGKVERSVIGNHTHVQLDENSK